MVASVQMPADARRFDNETNPHKRAPQSSGLTIGVEDGAAVLPAADPATPTP